ncbi:hypothetical protein F2Q69_00056962 [Brassica cretica]|uniref:Uncharacterized protein n=1 Tax=Brassica cretica TaxID=69181 RepID=A0A8S9N5V7_BRACR|nr:hypothetical protein F2Q69_00056962 [Brassica cretica]
MLHFVSDAQQGIPKLCPCGSITKEFVDEEDTYDYLSGKRYFICKDYQATMGYGCATRDLEAQTTVSRAGEASARVRGA